MRFLYELNHKVYLSETVYGIFHFRFRFVFIEVYIIVQQNACILWLQIVVIPFKIKVIEKPNTQICSQASDFEVATKIFKVQWYLRELELPKTDLVTKFFKSRKLKFWEIQFFFAVVTYSKYLTLLYLLTYLFLFSTYLFI